MIYTNDLINEAISLPVELRMVLINKLLESLNSIKPEIDTIWAKEAEKRVKELESGNIKKIPADEVYKEIKEKIWIMKISFHPKAKEEFFKAINYYDEH